MVLIQPSFLKISVKVKIIALLFTGLFCLLSFPAVAGGVEVVLRGDFLIRPAGMVRFSNATGSILLTQNDVISTNPCFRRPLAQKSTLDINEHQISFFPGASLRYLGASGFRLLTGRIMLKTSESTRPLQIIGNRYVLEYENGDFFVEHTADSGTFFALTSEGYAWLKDDRSKVVEFEYQQEVHVPLFSDTELSSRLSNRWRYPPEGFAVAPSMFTSQMNSEGDQTKSDSESKDLEVVDDTVLPENAEQKTNIKAVTE